MAASIATEERSEPSKSERKRHHKSLQDFVRQLIDAADSQVSRLGLPETVIEEINQARAMTRTALKRQIGFISKMMGRVLTTEEIEEAKQVFSSLQLPAASANAHFHLLEAWRDRLLAGDQELVEKLVAEFDADRQQIRQLVRLSNRETETEASPRSARQLFQYLRKISETM